MAATVNRDASDGRWTIDIPEADEEFDRNTAIRASIADISDAGGGLTHLWIHGIDQAADDAATATGFVAHRDLWQLRCPLPAEPSDLDTRAFTNNDVEDLIRVNNRAFSWHPEQSGMSRDSLAATMAEPWFDPDGLRLFEQSGELKGFCWTKVHGDEQPIAGEIFVIAVDPSVHGQGLGSPMTRSGLDWLSARGIEYAMLYVESDNEPANRTYERIGFVHHRTDRAYHRVIDSSSR